jgi:hypothetical protein
MQRKRATRAVSFFDRCCLFATSRGLERANFPLIVDSTGLKFRGAAEWLFEKHGTTKRRAWRKLHIGIDAGNGEIVAFDGVDGPTPTAS